MDTVRAMNVRLFAYTVGFLAVVVSVASFRTTDFAAVDPLMLLILVALAAVTQRMPVFLFRSSAISVSFASVIASYVLYGTGIGVFVSLCQAAVNAFTPRRKPLVKAAFNAGSLSTSAFVAGELFRMLGPQRGDLAATLSAVAVSALAYFLVNTPLTAGVIAISERQPFGHVWMTNYA